MSDTFQQLGTVFRNPDVKLHSVKLPCRLVCQKHLEVRGGGRRGKGGKGERKGSVREEGERWIGRRKRSNLGGRKGIGRKEGRERKEERQGIERREKGN